MSADGIVVAADEDEMDSSWLGCPLCRLRPDDDDSAAESV